MRAIYAVDVGKTSEPPNFAWARVEPDEGSQAVCSSVRDLVSWLEHDLERGLDVALGFEAPLSIPVPEDASELSRARTGEGRRAWSAPAGSTVAVLGLHQAAWVMQKLLEGTRYTHAFTLDPRRWPPNGSEKVFFCWEAFVSGEAHGSHEQDAVTAVMEFLKHENDLAIANAVTASRPFSLIGAAALWSGWASSPDVLHEPALVIKPMEPFRGAV